MKKRDLFIVVCLIAFGLVHNAIETGELNIGLFNGCNFRSSSLRDKHHPNDYKKEDIAISGSITESVKTIDFHNMAGHIDIVQSKDNSIRIGYKVRVYHRKKHKADRIAEDINVVTNIEKSKGELNVSVLPDENFPYSRVRVYFTLHVPANLKLDITNRYGHILADGLANPLKISHRYGNIELSKIGAPVKIQHRSGKVTLSDIKGKVLLAARRSRINLTGADSVKMEFTGSRASISQIKNQTDISYVTNSSIRIEDSAGVSISGRHTKIKLDGINGPVSVQNKYESMFFENINGDIKVIGKRCRIKAANIFSDSVVIKNAHRDVSMEAVSTKSLDIVLESGNLKLVLDRLDERLSIKNKHSHIKIDYPEDLKPLVNIGLQYGDFTNRTGKKFSIVKARERLTAQAQGESPQITINNKYGDLTLDTHPPRATVKPEPQPKPEQKSKPEPKKKPEPTPKKESQKKDK